ncbi:MAG: hypothetical protein AAGJ35_13225, partial [Myxococcota bacterium]
MDNTQDTGDNTQHRTAPKTHYKDFITCYTCGRRGHFRNDCPSNKTYEPHDGQGNTPHCNNCYRHGHTYLTCRQTATPAFVAETANAIRNNPPSPAPASTVQTHASDYQQQYDSQPRHNPYCNQANTVNVFASYSVQTSF